MLVVIVSEAEILKRRIVTMALRTTHKNLVIRHIQTATMRAQAAAGLVQAHDTVTH